MPFSGADRFLTSFYTQEKSSRRRRGRLDAERRTFIITRSEGLISVSLVEVTTARRESVLSSSRNLQKNFFELLNVI
jgi:hypothetical protein